MSDAEQDAHHANEKTDNRSCCKLFDHVIHGQKHLKPMSLWAVTKKLDLSTSGYVCRKCRREWYKIRDDLRGKGLTKGMTRKVVGQLIIKPTVILKRLEPETVSSCKKNSLQSHSSSESNVSSLRYTIIKRKISPENLDLNMSPIKRQKENKMNTLLDKVMTDNNIEMSDHEMLSDDEVHTKQNCESSTTCTIRERENYKLEEKRKERKKQFGDILEKLHECLREMSHFVPNTSENEEKHEMLNDPKRKKQSDDPLHNNVITEEEVENICKRDKNYCALDTMTETEIKDKTSMCDTENSPDLIELTCVNTSQYPNIDGSMPNATITQPLSNDTPFSDTRANPNRDESSQSSTMPRLAATISNVNQQQVFHDSKLPNSPQASHSKQLTPNIQENYCIPSTTYSHMSNANQRHSLGNTSHSVQDQYIPSADISNVGVQQICVNTSNISSSNTNTSSDTSMRLCEPVNQRDANMSPVTNTGQSCMMLKNTINSTATASAANTQQQKQVCCQLSQVNSETRPPLKANQNISPGICQTVHDTTSSPEVFTANLNASRTDALMGNDRKANVNQQQVSYDQQVSQTSLKKAQYNHQNPNENYYVPLSQPAHCNTQTHSVQNIQPDQNVQTLQQKLESQRLIQSKDTSVCSIDLMTNNISQDMPQNMSNKGAEISESQSKNCMQKKVVSTNPQQDLHQETSSAFNISQNTPGTTSKTSTSQKVNVLQNMFEVSLQKDSRLLILAKSILSQTDKVLTCNFNLAILTDSQKITLYNQIKSYFFMSDLLMYSYNKQELERMHHERTILLYLFLNLHDYIKSIIEESQTAEKCIGKDTQDNTSQNKLVLQENTMQTSIDKLKKTQFNRYNENDENNSMCNRNLEKQSSDQSIDLNISKNSKLTAVKSNLETGNQKLLVTPKFSTNKESLMKDTRLEEQNDNVLKKEFQKSSLTEMEKRASKSIEVSSPGHSRILEEDSIIEVSAKNLKAQDIETVNEEPLEAKKILLQKTSLMIEDEWNMEERMIQSIDTIEELEDIKEGDNEQSLLEIEKMQFEEMSLKFEVPKDTLSMEESELQSLYPKLFEDMEEEKKEIDIHSEIKIDELKHISEQEYYGNSQTSSCNSVQKVNSIDVNVEVFAENDVSNDSIECISVKSNDSEVTFLPNIKSISIFEKMENVDTCLQNNSKLNEKDGKSLNINDNLGNLDEIDNRPCLRCKRKSTVYCHCLEAYYCSKRCSFLHWNAQHHKQCKSRFN